MNVPSDATNMDIEEIRRNKPEGATHYEICGKEKPYALYWKFNDDGMFMYQELLKKWTRFRFMNKSYIEKTKPL